MPSLEAYYLLVAIAVVQIQHSLQQTVVSACIGAATDAFVIDPEDCAAFYQCKDGNSVRGTCPTGMFFSPTDICSFDDSYCNANAATTTSPELSTTTVTADGPPNAPTDIDVEQFCQLADPNVPSFMPSATNCEEYYTCVNRKPFLLHCADGRHWNQEQLYCDDPAEVNCNPSPMESPEEFCAKAPQDEPSFISSNTSCDEYFICIASKPFPMRCAPDRYWNQELLHCDDPENVDCSLSKDPYLTDLPKCPVRGNTFLEHPRLCELFIFCSDGSLSVQRCPFLTQWDRVEKRCIFRGTSKCSKRHLY